MAGRSKSGDRDDGVTVSFGAKFARSDQFKAVFREGMALVEAAATYLDGDGRKRARKLRPPQPPAGRRRPRGRVLDRMSIVDWLNESVPGGATSRFGQLLDIAYNIEYGEECSRQSSLNLLYLLGYVGQGQFRLFGKSNEKYRVRGGNDEVNTSPPRRSTTPFSFSTIARNHRPPSLARLDRVRSKHIEN